MHRQIKIGLQVALLGFIGLYASQTLAKEASGMVSTEVLLTSAEGHKLAVMAPVRFYPSDSRPKVLQVLVDPLKTRQTVTGIGTSFTESSAYVLAHLPDAARRSVMAQLFSDEGANFSLARTPIGATDFSVEGKYDYAPVPDDLGLQHFSIAEDRLGFDPARYPGVVAPNFDLLPMISEALTIKQGQADAALRIIASAWTAPPWMKDIEGYYQPGTPETDYQGTGGQLKPEYESVYADYLLRYLDAYAAAGVPIWGLTPVNEPEGNGGQWESMHFTAASQARFIQDHLGPKLQASAHAETKLLIYDQNRDHLEHWAETILSQPDVAQYVYGSAIHWYASTTNVYGDVLERVHERFPEFDLIHTEGTIDDLGKPAPGGIGDPVGFTETNWFNNDAFWWQRKATDWAYTASWAPNAEDHPMYTPVHRYARNIIGSLNHWVSGWIDWNPVLDERGGPNHVGNFCGAPIMVNLETKAVYFTPIFDVLSQFSRTIRPGDQAVTVSIQGDTLPEDALHVGATLSPQGLISIQLLNTQTTALTFSLGMLGQHAMITLPANALQTIRVDLSETTSKRT
ncbi:MAG: glycoside hydrolase family 30 beta sandwich domain-containing protein [Pseudomonadales bacterium]|nr:glycoside hydrolase family 30 beta sandwich domain-containing protein [Pseudomonadales bacterium]